MSKMLTYIIATHHRQNLLDAFCGLSVNNAMHLHTYTIYIPSAS